MNRSGRLLYGTAFAAILAGPMCVQAQTEVADTADERARQLFRRGVALAEAERCDDALPLLERSLAIAERTSTLFNMGQCEEVLRRYGQAIAHYERLIEISAADDSNRLAGQAALSALLDLLGTLEVTSNAIGEVWLDGDPIGRFPGPVMMPGGRHVIQLRARGFRLREQEVSITARQTSQLIQNLERAYPDPAQGSYDFGGADLYFDPSLRQPETSASSGHSARTGQTQFTFVSPQLRISEYGMTLSLAGGVQLQDWILSADIAAAFFSLSTAPDGRSQPGDLLPRALSALTLRGAYRLDLGEHILTPRLEVLLPNAVGDGVSLNVAQSMSVWNMSQWIHSHVGIRLGTAYLLRDRTLLVQAQATLDLLLPTVGTQDIEFVAQAMGDFGFYLVRELALGVRLFGFVYPTNAQNAGQLAFEPFLLVNVAPQDAPPSFIRAGFLFNVDDPWGFSFTSPGTGYAFQLSGETWF